MTSTPKRPPTAQEFVLEQLRVAIASRELIPGVQIRQDALAEKYGTSRVPLREALKILEGEGQVTYVPHRGYFVTELSLEDLLEVYRIREILEKEAIAQAVANLTEEDLELIEAALQETESASLAGDISAMTAANRKFHFLIFELSNMPRLTRLIRVLWDATDAYRAVYYSSANNRDRVDHEHREILLALKARDEIAAINLLDQHRNHAVEQLREVLADVSHQD
ncbi:MAG: hypothetical protein RIS75_101 [Actinomycetota bacterium]|jgi:DNA-binding GntR family transcriptional regulator